jgi:hypothetical protein
MEAESVADHPRMTCTAESRTQRRYAEKQPLDCIVSRLWLVYKSVERRALRAGRAAFLGITGDAQGEVRRCQCDRILAA